MTKTSTPEQRWPTPAQLNLPLAGDRPPAATPTTTTPAKQAPTPLPSISNLTARAASASAEQPQQLAQLASQQMSELANLLTQQVTDLAAGLNKHVNAALSSTSTAITEDLEAMRRASRQQAWLIRRWTLWPPLASLAISVLILIGATLISAHRISGIPATEITTPSGNRKVVLTQPGWRTCNWQGHKQPCRNLK